ncbi:hypothetical protein DFR70_12735 [Nocardia tenerifensis]|uniref:Uncharacterized protein n=1 Tax=Nocardia tenerifensis TaxID=228006 RepID=A0A318JS59_9NOCA|nr:hypothetical protein [Nocardia tenerifensis]PXX53424.1 hypothetical protein DFR70_12735 [Nocardia tenerifensis]
MSLFAFTEYPSDNCADHGSAYTIFRTDDAPVSGQVFVNLREHYIVVDGHREPRPAAGFRFFGLTVDQEWLGTLKCSVAFYPDWMGLRFGESVQILGESGHLITDYGRQLSRKPQVLRETVSDLVQAISVDFLTDSRVAEYRWEHAEQRRQQLSRRADVLSMQQEMTYRRLCDARAATAAAYALVTSVRDKAKADREQ